MFIFVTMLFLFEERERIMFKIIRIFTTRRNSQQLYVCIVIKNIDNDRLTIWILIININKYRVSV